MNGTTFCCRSLRSSCKISFGLDKISRLQIPFPKKLIYTTLVFPLLATIAILASSLWTFKRVPTTFGAVTDIAGDFIASAVIVCTSSLFSWQVRWWSIGEKFPFICSSWNWRYKFLRRWGSPHKSWGDNKYRDQSLVFACFVWTSLITISCRPLWFCIWPISWRIQVAVVQAALENLNLETSRFIEGPVVLVGSSLRQIMRKHEAIYKAASLVNTTFGVPICCWWCHQHLWRQYLA